MRIPTLIFLAMSLAVPVGAIAAEGSVAAGKAKAEAAGCNGCHHALDHGFIVIQRPAVLPYSNQVFTPQQ